jgi:hypothetical protein
LTHTDGFVTLTLRRELLCGRSQILLRKAVNQNAILVAISIILALVVGELACKYLNLSGQRHHKLFCQHDPVLGWSKIPNATGRHYAAEYDIVETINSRGIRGPEYSYAKDPNKVRIMILGDSFAEGYVVEFNDQFSEVLKTSVNSRGHHDCEVINTGTGGWSTDQEFLFFLHEGLKYGPDITILMFCSNDVWYNARDHYWRGSKPLFILKNGQLELTNVPVPRVQSLNPIKFLGNWLEEDVSLYALASHVKSVIEGSARVPNRLPGDWQVFANHPERSIVEGWNVTEQLLIKLSEETSKIRSKLLVVYIPWRAAIYRDEWQDIIKEYRLDPKDWEPDIPGQYLAELSKKHDIAFFDLTPPLREESKLDEAKTGRLYYTYDDHWSVRGHSVVGKVLSDYLYYQSKILE